MTENINNVSVRKAELKDLKIIIEILKQGRHYTNVTINPNVESIAYNAKMYGGVYWEDKKTQLIKNLSDNKYQYWVICINDNVVGFSEIIYEPEWMELDKIYILPKYHSQGLGRILIEHTLKNLHQHDQDLKLEVINYNKQAINFYTKYGFVKTSTKLEPFVQPDGSELPAIEMLLPSNKLVDYKSLE